MSTHSIKDNSKEQEVAVKALQWLTARRYDIAAYGEDEYDNSISPAKCHYRKVDVSQLTTVGTDKISYNEAIEKLRSYELYKVGGTYDLKIKADKTITLDKASLLKYFNMTEEQMISQYQARYNVSTTDNSNVETTTHGATEGQKAQAAQQAALIPGPRDFFNTLSGAVTGNQSIVLSKDGYVRYLCEGFNTTFRASKNKPQLPTSIGVAIALARTEFKTENIGLWNFWRIPYIEGMTNLNSDTEYCAFNNQEEGFRSPLVLCLKDGFKTDVSGLKEKMSESSDTDKLTAIKKILERMDTANADAQYAAAVGYIQQYNLFNWDTDKTEAEGGHADTKSGVDSKSKEAKQTEKSLAKTITSVAQELGIKGVGVQIIPMGGEYVKIIKLPKGKTPCEPVYPDFVTVGDTIPEWIMSESYAQAYKAAEEKAFKAAGIATQSDEEIELENVNKKISGFEEQQFNAWCQANNISCSTEEERIEAQKKYAEAATENPDQFTNGVYIPDSATKSVYKSLLKDKLTLENNGDTATAVQHLKYLDSQQSVKAAIAERESGWNQDVGSPYVDDGSIGTVYSAVNNGSTPVINSSGGSSSSAGVEAMVSWAINIAADQSHGYSQAARTGPDYDCSSFVFYALDAGGFKVIEANGGYAGTTDTLWPALQKIGGWQRYSWDNVSNSIQRGDILHRESGHLAIAVSSDKTVEASGVNSGQGSPATGDQGTEIDQYNVHNRNWTYVYRYQGTGDSTGSNGGSNSKVDAMVAFAVSKAGGTYSMDNRDGPTSYDCSSLVYYSIAAAGFPIISAWQKNPRYSATGDIIGAGATATGGYGGQQKVGDVDTIWMDIQTMGTAGWKKMSWSTAQSSLKRGDIIAYWKNDGSEGHCYIMKDNSTTIEARSAHTNPNIGSWPVSQRTPSYDVQEVYRYEGS